MFMNKINNTITIGYVATYLQVIPQPPGAVPFADNNGYLVRQFISFLYQCIEAIGQAVIIV